MGRELGRISGPLLSENLRRNGNNLVFDNDLLFLNVNNGRIGINTLAPARELHAPSAINTTNLIVDTLSEIANFSISTDSIQNPLSSITISPAQSNPVITTPGLATSLLRFSGNQLINTGTNSDINFSPVGSGITNIRNDVLVTGGVHSTGSITWDGDIVLGDSTSDTINFKADVNSDLIPNVLVGSIYADTNDPISTETYSGFILESGGNLVLEPGTQYTTVSTIYTLGSSDLEWNVVYSKNFDAYDLNTSIIRSTTGYIGNLKLEANNISNISDTADILLSPNGTGVVNFNGLQYVNGSILSAPALTFNSTTNGYTKIAGSNGVVIPSGSAIGTSGVETGTMRFNTDTVSGEIFNGTNWQPVGGVSAVLNINEVTDAMYAWDLILG